MASLSYFLSLSLLLTFIISAYAQNGLILPIRKDPKTSQFYTTIQMGSHRTTINAALDLGGRHLWFACDNFTSTTYAPVPCNSAKCDLAGFGGCIVSCNGPTRPGCTPNTCGGYASSNPYVDYITNEGYYEDTLTSKDNVHLPEFMFSCVPGDFTAGLANGVTGLLGFAMNPISVHKQVSDKLGLPDKFSICPPSSGLGKLAIGSGLSSRSDISSLMKSTRLIINPNSTASSYTVGDPSEEYFIDVRSIRVAGEALAVKDSYFNFDRNGVGGTKLSTLQNYTSLHNSIYKPLTRAFDKAAADMGIRSAAAVAPFRACYRSESISRTAAGPVVPVIDLVLPGTDVYWRINGANSMVEIDRKTSCLALVDGGSRPRTSIVIGIHQLEENLVEFDVPSLKLSFSSSLLVHNKTCSRL